MSALPTVSPPDFRSVHDKQYKVSVSPCPCRHLVPVLRLAASQPSSARPNSATLCATACPHPAGSFPSCRSPVTTSIARRSPRSRSACSGGHGTVWHSGSDNSGAEPAGWAGARLVGLDGGTARMRARARWWTQWGAQANALKPEPLANLWQCLAALDEPWERLTVLDDAAAAVIEARRALRDEVANVDGLPCFHARVTRAQQRLVARYTLRRGAKRRRRQE